MATCVNFGNGGFGPNHNCALPGMSMKKAKKPNMAKQKPTNFFSKGQSAMPPAAFTVGSGFAPDAVEFTIVELIALLFFWWFAIISTVALSATSLSLVDIIIVVIGRIDDDDDDDAESTFFFATTCTNREDDLLPKAAAEATRERASADEVDVKANMRYY